MQRLPRFKGHFFNWYDTRDLRALDPGLRLVGRQRQSRRPSDRARQRLRGMDATRRRAGQSGSGMARRPSPGARRRSPTCRPRAASTRQQLAAILDEIDAHAEARRSRSRRYLPALTRLTDKAGKAAPSILPERRRRRGRDRRPDPFWIEALRKAVDRAWPRPASDRRAAASR